jgi:hypothetical protein
MVNFDNTQQAAAPDPWAFIDSVGGSKSISFVTKDEYGRNVDLPIGTFFEGTVVGTPRVTQQRDFDTQQPKFYDDGNPMMQLVVMLQTQLHDDSEDDGRRGLYVKGQMLRALQDEMRDKGVKQFGEGSYLRVTHTGLKPSQRGNPQKLYEISLQATPITDPQANALLAGGQPQQPVQQQGQYVNPQAGQWAAPQPPAAAPAQQAPVQQYQPPVQQAPQVPAGAAAVQAVIPGAVEVPAQQQAPATPQGAVPVVTQQMVDQANLLIRTANFPREAAIAAVANNDEALIRALDPHIPF